MARRKDVWVCRDCGVEHAKWQGQCTGCNEWNTLEQVTAIGASAKAASWTGQQAPVTRLAEVEGGEVGPDEHPGRPYRMRMSRPASVVPMMAPRM